MPTGVYERRKPNGMLGKHQSEYQKIVVGRINSELQKGENNSNWRGGLRTNNPKEYSKQWRHSRGISKRYRGEIVAIPMKFVKQAAKARKKYEGSITSRDIQNVYDENISQFGELTCFYCLKPTGLGQDSIDHKYRILGNKKSNLVIACRSCNSAKQDKTPEEFIKTRKP